MKSTDDEGLGLVEIVVAMLVLAALAIAILPLLVQGLQLSARNATLASGLQQVNDRLQAAQDLSPNCSAIRGLYASGPETYTDGRNVVIRITTTVGACPTTASDPLYVKVTSTAVRLDTGTDIATASTLVYVTRGTP